MRLRSLFGGRPGISESSSDTNGDSSSLRESIKSSREIRDVLGYHLKTGHTLSLQNRPTDLHPGQEYVVSCRSMFRQVLFPADAAPHGPQGDRARGISAERFEIPLAGGGAQFAPWGEPSPPRLAPGGNGKGGSGFSPPQADFVRVRCFMTLLAMGWWPGATPRHYFPPPLPLLWCANSVDRT